MIGLRTAFLVLGFATFGLVSGCQPGYEVDGEPQAQDVIAHGNLSENVSIKEAPLQMRGQSGAGIGYVRPEDRDSSPIGRQQNDEFRLKEGEDLSLYLILLNCWDDSRTFLVSMILDYQQIGYGLDGEDGLLHKIVVPGNTEIDLPLKLKVDGPGAHDLIGVIFEDPDNLTLDNGFRLDLYGHVYGRRTQIIVGEDQEPAGATLPLITGTPIPADVGFTARLYFASNGTDEGVNVSQRQLYTGKAVAGEAYEFQMICNNIEDRSAVYALVPFLDFHQVDVSGQKQFFVYLNPNEEAVVDQRVLLPESPAIHQFQVIWLFDPYKSILQKEVYAPYVFGSPRIAIDTR